MNYIHYKVLHLISIVLLFLSLGMIVVSARGPHQSKSKKNLMYVFYGLAWLAVFVTSLGLVSVMGLHENFPTWGKLKTYIWLTIGLMPLIFWKWPKYKTALSVVTLILGFAAITLAVSKSAFV